MKGLNRCLRCLEYYLAKQGHECKVEKVESEQGKVKREGKW